MTIQVRAYSNSDEVTIVWRSDGPIKGCLGFALHRQARDATGQLLKPEVGTAVETWVGFETDPNAHNGTHQPSTTWPIQRFIWSDYFLGGAAEVRYQVVPMGGQPGSLKPLDPSSDWTPWAKVGTGQTAGFKAWFNHGIVASQWVERALSGGSPSSLLDQDIRDPKNPVRAELGGELRRAMLDQMDLSNKAGETIYAALYELNDPELIPALESFGKRCNLVLGSGAYKAGELDENADVRDQLRKSKQINLFDRLVKSPHFAHNKFIVFCDADGKPLRLWTGSTNWTVTGLCTQVNNGILVDDPTIAAAYLARWQQIKGAGSDYPASLSQQGSTPGRSRVGSSSLTAWNAPTSNFVDLADARRLIQGARQGVLFLMFNPGPKNTLLNDILALDEHKLFVHGVVNQDPGGKADPLFTLHDRGDAIDAEPEVVVPTEIKNSLNKWFGDEYKGKMVCVHSKVIVVDPFGTHPVVMTGSHNLGPKASSKNDDNLLIVENAPGLAAEYAVNILGVFAHYKYRYNLHQNQTGAQVWKGLQTSDSWQNDYFKAGKRREIDFWFGDLVPANT